MIVIVATYVMMMMICWLGWGRKCISKGKVATLDFGVREDHHTGIVCLAGRYVS